MQSWFIGVRFFKAEICPGSHSLRGYQWSLKDSGVRVRTRIARGIFEQRLQFYLKQTTYLFTSGILLFWPVCARLAVTPLGRTSVVPSVYFSTSASPFFCIVHHFFQKSSLYFVLSICVVFVIALSSPSLSSAVCCLSSIQSQQSKESWQIKMSSS